VTGAVGLDVPGCHGSSSVAVAVDVEGSVAAAVCANSSPTFP
jgi:hypothetical protein